MLYKCLINLTFAERLNVNYQIFSRHGKTGIGFALILPTIRDDYGFVK